MGKGYDMALVKMTKAQFVERWQNDAIKKVNEKKERERKAESELYAYITETIAKKQHNIHMKMRNRRFKY